MPARKKETVTRAGPGILDTRYQTLPVPWNPDNELRSPTMVVHEADGGRRSVNEGDFHDGKRPPPGPGPVASETGRSEGASSVFLVSDHGFRAAFDQCTAVSHQPVGTLALLPDDILGAKALQRHLGMEPKDGKSVARILQDKLWKSRVACMMDQRPEEEQDRYLPIDALYRILDTTSVASLMRELFPRATLQEVGLKVALVTGSHEGEGRSSGDRKCRRRILAILLLSKRLDALDAFIENGVWDEDLPLQRQGDSTNCHTHTDPEHVNTELFKGWELNDLTLFDAYQSTFHVPFFDLRDDRLCSYEFSAKTRLPWSSRKKVDIGGGGTVYRVGVHPGHHNYRVCAEIRQALGSEEEPLYFALKEIDRFENENYKKELRAHEKACARLQRGEHIIKLLLTFEHGRYHYLMFEWADGPLDDFWERRLAKEPPGAERWAAEQCLGLATALKQIHGLATWQREQREARRRDRDVSLGPDTGEEAEAADWGRHGDIKPRNILWFSRYGKRKDHLVISDLGLTRYHSLLTRSRITSSRIEGFSDTYRPPELDLDKPVSRRSDVWSLGCVLLEFCTWYLMGHDGLLRFEDARVRHDKTDIQNLREDKFFILESGLGSGTRTAKLKPAVQEWIKELGECADRAGSSFLHHVLGLVDTKMLVIEVADRQPIDVVCAEMLAIVGGFRDDARSATSLPPSPTVPAEGAGDFREGMPNPDTSEVGSVVKHAKGNADSLETETQFKRAMDLPSDGALSIHSGHSAGNNNQVADTPPEHDNPGKSPAALELESSDPSQLLDNEDSCLAAQTPLTSMDNSQIFVNATTATAASARSNDSFKAELDRLSTIIQTPSKPPGSGASDHLPSPHGALHKSCQTSLPAGEMSQGSPEGAPTQRAQTHQPTIMTPHRVQDVIKSGLPDLAPTGTLVPLAAQPAPATTEPAVPASSALGGQSGFRVVKVSVDKIKRGYYRVKVWLKDNVVKLRR